MMRLPDYIQETRQNVYIAYRCDGKTVEEDWRVEGVLERGMWRSWDFKFHKVVIMTKRENKSTLTRIESESWNRKSTLKANTGTNLKLVEALEWTVKRAALIIDE